MPVSVKDNSLSVLQKIRQGHSLALRYLLDDIDNLADPRTPKKYGRLRNDKIKQVLGLRATIVWTKKYAAAQEAGVIKGTRISNYTTGGTGPHFAETAVKTGLTRIGESLRKAGL